MTLQQWNARQGTVLLRWGRLYRMELSPEAVLRIATRYAVKHGPERRMLAA